MPRHPLHDPNDPFSPGVRDDEVVEMWVLQEAWPELLSDDEIAARVAEKHRQHGDRTVDLGHDYMSNPPTLN